MKVAASGFTVNRKSRALIEREIFLAQAVKRAQWLCLENMEIMFAQLSLVTAWNFAEDSRKTLMFGTSKLFRKGSCCRIRRC
jgi:hypothetical protein